MMRRGLPVLALAAVLGLPVAARAEEPRATPRVVGGGPTQTSWPAQAYVKAGNFNCAGTLITPEWLLTAAHCTYAGATGPPIAASSFTVWLGSNQARTGTQYAVSRIVRHPSHDPPRHPYDVALLKLDRAAPQQPLTLVGPSESALWAPGVEATIIGWGTTTRGGSPATQLQEAQVPMVDDATCQRTWSSVFDRSSMVCAGGKGVDTCNGDSGGPLMVPRAGAFAIVGVISFGASTCATADSPSVYARVGEPALNQWIRDVAGLPVPAPVATTAPGGPGVSSTGPPAVSTSPPIRAVSSAAGRFPAKLKVLRASVRDGRLDALFSLTGRATGKLQVAYQAAGRVKRYTVDVGPARSGEKNVRLVRRLDSSQRRRSSGIVNVAFAGNALTGSDELRFRAANGRSRLDRGHLTFAQGRLRVSGSVDRDVSGIVRLRATYAALDGTPGVWEGRATIEDGRWSADAQLPAGAAADPNAYLSMQFTGDLTARGGPYRGEQDGKGLGNLE